MAPLGDGRAKPRTTIQISASPDPLPDRSSMRLRARMAMAPGTLGRLLGSEASLPDSSVCAAATTKAPGKIPRKDRLRMSLLRFQLYHFHHACGAAMIALSVVTFSFTEINCTGVRFFNLRKIRAVVHAETLSTCRTSAINARELNLVPSSSPERLVWTLATQIRRPYSNVEMAPCQHCTWDNFHPSHVVSVTHQFSARSG
jgi:hypothetical protein